jgi:hypothetical protein
VDEEWVYDTMDTHEREEGIVQYSTVQYNHGSNEQLYTIYDYNKAAQRHTG